MKCLFCSRDIESGTGKSVIQNNGKVLNFCSNKCEKNRLKLNRDSRNFKWTRN